MRGCRTARSSATIALRTSFTTTRGGVPDGGTTAMFPLGGALVTLGALRRKRAQ